MEQALSGSSGGGGGGWDPIMHIHVSKCKNDKTKFLKA
jgi:hypothetical protein